MNSFYENHLSIKQNKLCPFKLQKSFVTTTVPYNWHKNVEIILVTEGEGAIQYSADTLNVRVDDIVIINSGALHRPYSDVGIGYYYLIIDDSFCTENGINITEFTFKKVFRDEKTKELFKNVTQLMNAYEDAPCTITVVGLRIAILTLLADICEKHSAPTVKSDAKCSPSEKHVKQVIDHINKCFTEPLCLESLADLCGVTKYHLSREFKKHTGQTVFSYLNTLRCQNAKILISNGMNITEAAYASGFDSLSYFSRTYKKKMGQSPSKIKVTH